MKTRIALVVCLVFGFVLSGLQFQSGYAQPPQTVGLKHRLSETVWHVENRSMDKVYKDTEAEITFGINAESFNLDSGRIAALGMSDGFNPNDPPMYEIENIICEFMSGDILFVKWDVLYPGGQSTMCNTVILSDQGDTLILVGQGGIGPLGETRCSILTRQ